MSAATAISVVARDLLATGASVGVARSVVSSFLRAQGLGLYEERAVAVISELATNAVAVSGPADIIRVYATVHPGRLWMGVSDTALGLAPKGRDAVSTLEEIDAATSDEFGGWGLALVAAYADKVWTEPANVSGSKWVCASIELRAAE